MSFSFFPRQSPPPPSPPLVLSLLLDSCFQLAVENESRHADKISSLRSGLRESIAVKVTAAYCALSFVIIQVLYLGVWCRPITNYWAVPIPPGNGTSLSLSLSLSLSSLSTSFLSPAPQTGKTNSSNPEQCKTYHSHLITTTVLHVSTDLAMLAIPIPMIARTRLPLRRRLVLCGVFGLGVLVVLVAILNRYYNFVMPHDLVFLAWYNGEASTAVVIANVPFCWALLRRVFSLDSWGGNSHDGGGLGDGDGNGDRRHQSPPTIGSGGPPRRGGRGRGRGDDDGGDSDREEEEEQEGGLRAMGRVMGGRDGFGFVQTKSVSITVEYTPRPGWRQAPAAAPARDAAAVPAEVPAAGEEDGVELLERGAARGRGEPGS